MNFAEIRDSIASTSEKIRVTQKPIVGKKMVELDIALIAVLNVKILEILCYHITNNEGFFHGIIV